MVLSRVHVPARLSNMMTLRKFLSCNGRRGDTAHTLIDHYHTYHPLRLGLKMHYNIKKTIIIIMIIEFLLQLIARQKHIHTHTHLMEADTINLLLKETFSTELVL